MSSQSSVVFAAVAAFAAAFAVSCTSAAPVACTVSNCNGCCAASGECVVTTAASACGTQGGACGACQPGLPSEDGGLDGGDVTCLACVSSTDCLGLGACVQISGSDACANLCVNGQCPADEHCVSQVSAEGTQVTVCVPLSGQCGAGPACPAPCPAGTACDTITATCQATGAGGGSGTGGSTGTGGSGGSTCGTLEAPTTTSCCSSCAPGAANCQANGCYGGWWCDRASCKCHQPPTSCGGTGGGAGTGGGTGTGGSAGTGGSTGSVGPTGGTVSRLYFAVVGDTRPAVNNDTAKYPSTVITQIYQAIENLNPRPQFVVTTGDYVFASPGSGQAAPQMDAYLAARQQFSGTVFPAMGNHECAGATLGNCSGVSAGNLPDFVPRFLAPIHQAKPYFSFDVHDTAGAWTAKFIFAACNMWDATQDAWVKSELARSTTHTFVVRHENLGVASPCSTQMDAALRASPYTMFIAGHTHTYSHTGKTLVEGVGGAPITGNAVYGFATVEQLASGWKVTQYDSSNGRAVDTFTVP